MPPPRHDQRDPSPQKPGKRTIAYPSGLKTYPVITESGTSRKTPTDRTGDFLAAHPEYTQCLRTDQRTDKGDDTDKNLVETFEKLPGPWIPFTRWDAFLGPVQGRQRAVQNSGQVATLTATTKTTYQARGESAIVSIELEETNSDGTGTTGNPAYPIYTDDFYDDKARGPVQSATQIVVATGSESGSLTESGGTVTKIRYESIPGDSFHLKKVTETWTLPGPVIPEGDKPDIDADIFITQTRQLKKISLITSGFSVTTGAAKILHKADYDTVSAFEVITIFPASTHIDAASAVIQTEKRPYQFPTYLNIEALDDYGADGTAIGLRKAFCENALMTTREWFVADAVTVPSFADDEIWPGDITINGVSYKGVLHDTTTRLYNATAITIPNTLPSFTEYYGTPDPLNPFAPGSGAKWIDTQRVIRGSVKRDGHPRRWRLTTESVTMR